MRVRQFYFGCGVALVMTAALFPFAATAYQKWVATNERNAIIADGAPLQILGDGVLVKDTLVRGDAVCATWPAIKDRARGKQFSVSARFYLKDALGHVFETDASSNFNPGNALPSKFRRCMSVPGSTADPVTGGLFAASIGTATFHEVVTYCHLTYRDLCFPVRKPPVYFDIIR